MTTAAAVRVCNHLASGGCSAYVEFPGPQGWHVESVADAERYCLVCAALLYHHDPIKYASWQHVYLLEKEAREQQRRGA